MRKNCIVTSSPHHHTLRVNQFVPPTFWLINLYLQLFACFAFTGIIFLGILQHVCDVAYEKNMCGPIRTHKMLEYKLIN